MPKSNASSTLVFLDVTHPTRPRGRDAQRVIRSHVTRLQHQQRRERHRLSQCGSNIEISRPATESCISSDDQHTPVSDHASPKSLFDSASPSATQPSESGLPFLNSSHPSQIKHSDARRLVRSHVTKWQHKRRRKEAVDAIDLLERATECTLESPCTDARLPHLPLSSSEKLISKGAAAIRNVILADSSNTIATAITRLGLDLRSVMAHYYYMALDVHAPEFEAHYDMKGICRRVFLPFLFSDPALTCAIVLIAVIHRMSLMHITEWPPELLHLRGFVIMAINHALQDPTRACSDQLIFAVANLAIFEAVFGSIEVYHVHMKGLSRMLRLRGGLPSLGFDGYLQKVLLWYDSNCANLVGCDPYLSEWEPTYAEYEEFGMKPDPANFTVGLTAH